MKRRQNLQIELNAFKSQSKVEVESKSGFSYEQLIAKNKEQENDLMIMKYQQKTVVVYNKETGTFEYIG